MKDRHVTERELGLVAPWARALTLTLGLVSWAVAGAGAADAQTTGASDNPSAFLAAPADGVDFYLKTETAARLLDERSRRLNAPSNVPAPLFLSHIRENHWLQALPDRHAIFVQVKD